MVRIDYRDESRKNYGCTQDSEHANIEQLNCGSLMRIADATEAMAKNHIALQSALDDANRRITDMQRRIKYLINSNAGLRGALTKLKNKAR